MTMDALVPIVLLACSLLPAVSVASLRRGRHVWTLGGAAIKLVVLGFVLARVEAGRDYALALPLAPGLELALRIDALALLFVGLSAVLWLATSVYAIAYLARDRTERRFFTFFNLCVTATTGIAIAGNLFTFFVFYELLTLSTWPLVAHYGDRASLRAARRYLVYALTGSAVLLAGAILLQSLTGPLAFGDTGRVAELRSTEPTALRWCFALIVTGLAVKTAMVPLHGWLPAAMVAPAPVSALLHAVAVVKAGAFGILRLVVDVFGIETTAALGLGTPLAVWASLTIVTGSLLALRQTDLKRRLAYSTVSQVSYIVLGAGLLGPAGLVGGLVHLVHQGLMKITLFFCAGALEKLVHVKRVDEMGGIGWRLPWTMVAFTLAAVGMLGGPPLAGFVSKWYLGLGGLESGAPWVLAVLAASMLLNALYFLPLVYAAWFERPPGSTAPRTEFRREVRSDLRRAPLLVAPAAFTAALALAAGLFAASDTSPLAWAEVIVERNASAPWALPR